MNITCGECVLIRDWTIFMMTSSNGNIFRVTGPLCREFTGPGEFPIQRPVTRSFDVFFDLRLNKRLSKQPWGWWFERLSWSLWRHRNDSNDEGQHGRKSAHLHVSHNNIRHVLSLFSVASSPLLWRHNEHNGVSNHQHYVYLLNCPFRRRSKKISKLRVTGVCAVNSYVTSEFPTKMASTAENVSIWWRHHVLTKKQECHSLRSLHHLLYPTSLYWSLWTPQINFEHIFFNFDFQWRLYYTSDYMFSFCFELFHHFNNTIICWVHGRMAKISQCC